MSEFEKSEWAEAEHAKEFMENADIYILERKRLFSILRSFYRYFLMDNEFKGPVKVLDLGCGDGALTLELLKEDNQINATLVDGSLEMLENAGNNLKNYGGMDFVHKTFQDLLEDQLNEKDRALDSFNLVVSSLAIHHIHFEEKKSLFQYIYDHLEFGGFFLNIETIKAPTDELESWSACSGVNGSVKIRKN